MELDQSFVGGRSVGERGRSSDKASITMAVERDECGRLGRVRLELADKVGGLDMIDFACDVVGPGATIRTDGARMFTRLADKGFFHVSTPGNTAEDCDAVMPGPHLVSALLKRWTAGTSPHRISRQHLPYYLNEFTFRFNRRKSRREECCSTDCSSRPWIQTRTRLRSSSAADLANCTQTDM